LSLEEIVTSYGYLAVLAGTFLEGEAILVIAGFLAHRGYLELPLVILSAFAGTLAGDQLYFHIGRIKGQAFLDRRPGLKARGRRVQDLLARHQVLLILGFRFIYGIRTATPFVLGASGVASGRYFVLNSCGALAWAAAFGAAGYYFGHALEVLLGEVKQFERWIVAGMLAASVAAWIWSRWRARRQRPGDRVS